MTSCLSSSRGGSAELHPLYLMRHIEKDDQFNRNLMVYGLVCQYFLGKFNIQSNGFDSTDKYVLCVCFSNQSLGVRCIHDACEQKQVMINFSHINNNNCTTKTCTLANYSSIQIWEIRNWKNKPRVNVIQFLYV